MGTFVVLIHMINIVQVLILHAFWHRYTIAVYIYTVKYLLQS